MLSLFSIPKSFTGRIEIIQDNAIGSWTRLGAGCEIILCGDDAGVAEAATRHGVRHEPVIARNEFGTPLLTDLFTRMDALARFPIVGLVNTDTILVGDFLSSIRATAQARDKFLVVSSRFNCRINEPLTFEPGWEEGLRKRARHENRMYPAAGSDLFVYRRGLYGSVPPFAIGRGYWDNWLMGEARRRDACVVDATATLTAVHQEHVYDHVAGVAADTDDKAVYATEEGQRNLALAGGYRRLNTVYDAAEVLTADGRLLSTWRIRLVHRRIKAFLRRAASRVTVRNAIAG